MTRGTWMDRGARRRGTGAAALLAAMLVCGAARADDQPEPAQVRLATLLEKWAEQTKRRLLVSPNLRDVRVPATPDPDRAALMRLAGHVNAVLIETEESIEAVPERDAAQSFGHYPAKVFVGDAALPEGNVPVTLVLQLTNSGSSVFANLRGLMSRDTTRAGNILYVQGSELLVITDFAPKVAYYRQMARLLDGPALPSPQAMPWRMWVYEVPRADWAELRNLPPAEAARKLAAAAKDGRARELESARVTALGADFRRTRALRLKEEQLDLDLATFRRGKENTYPQAPPVLRLSVTRRLQGEETSSQLELSAPDQAALVGAAFAEGEKPTHLVLVMVPER
ncbi:MAG: hypothetical protein AB7N76_05585 [Planctomycetota bacterium]